MFIYFGMIVFVLGSNGQEQLCPSTSGTQDVCVGIQKCKSVLSLLSQGVPLTETEANNLKKLHCGFEGNAPKVCCPSIELEETQNSTVIPDLPDVGKHPNLRLLENDTCGNLVESKIILGEKTGVTDFPWMALIAYKVNGEGSPQFGCGGSLVTKRYVLTAAHCVTALGSGLELSGVRIGEHDISREIDCDGMGEGKICADKYEDFLIESFLIHSEYDKMKRKNDIALIRLNGEADFTRSNVKPICLPIGDAALQELKKVIVTGWGTTELGYRSQVLLKVRLEIATNDECAKAYRDQNDIEITYKQLCAGGKTRADSCAGDSGGPLQYPTIINNVPKYVQYGIVAFGPSGCGVIGIPGVYTKVVYYVDWILDNIAANR